MDQAFKNMVDKLIDDKEIDEETKIEMLNDWRMKLIANNLNQIMSKYEAEKHFKWLGRIDGAIAALGGEIRV